MRKRETRQKKLKISTVPSARHFLFYIKIAQNCFFFLSLDIVLYETNLSVLFLFDKYE